jgi:hypothetical protein
MLILGALVFWGIHAKYKISRTICFWAVAGLILTSVIITQHFDISDEFKKGLITLTLYGTVAMFALLVIERFK